MSEIRNEDIPESKLENPRCENKTGTVLHTPTSKFGNTIFNIYLFENRKIVRSKNVVNRILWNLKSDHMVFLNENIRHRIFGVTGWNRKWGIMAQEKIRDFNG